MNNNSTSNSGLTCTTGECIKKKYTFAVQLGDGTFGDVFKAVNNQTLEVVAIKRMKKKYTNSTWQECIDQSEIKILEQLNHPNIVKLKEVYRDIDDQLYFIFEYLDTNLYEKIKDRGKLLPEGKIRNYIYQILQGLSYMHDNGWFHRDMKPENILVLNDTVKIADFGLARAIDAKPPFSGYVSTRWYRAPEVLLRTPTYNHAIDIWAVGTIMAELYSLKPLFPGGSELDQLFKISAVLGSPTLSTWPDGIKLSNTMNFKFPTMLPMDLASLLPNANSDAIDLMTQMLRYDPRRRPLASQALQHPYFKVTLPIMIFMKPNHTDKAVKRLKQTNSYKNNQNNNNNNNNNSNYQNSSNINSGVSSSIPIKQNNNNNNNNNSNNSNNRKINPYLRSARYSPSLSTPTSSSSSSSSLSLNQSPNNQNSILSHSTSPPNHHYSSSPSTMHHNHHHHHNHFTPSPPIPINQLSTPSSSLLSNQLNNQNNNNQNNSKPSPRIQNPIYPPKLLLHQIQQLPLSYNSNSINNNNYQPTNINTPSAHLHQYHQHYTQGKPIMINNNNNSNNINNNNNMNSFGQAQSPPPPSFHSVMGSPQQQSQHTMVGYLGGSNTGNTTSKL